MNETLEIIKQRRSVRNFRDEQIKDEEVELIVEAGSFAPNAGGQAWHFTVVQNRELLQKLNLAAKEAARQTDYLNELGNDEKFNCLYEAPTLILVSGYEASPVPLDGDCAAATQNLLLAAESLGIGSCWIYFVTLAFNSSQSAELLKALQIPEGYKPYTAAVFGYKRSVNDRIPKRKPNLITYIK
jgi:Nitroreductase